MGCAIDLAQAATQFPGVGSPLTARWIDIWKAFVEAAENYVHYKFILIVFLSFLFGL